MAWLLAILMKPFLLFGFLAFAVSIEMAVRRWLPDGKLKRLLLKRW